MHHEVLNQPQVSTYTVWFYETIEQPIPLHTSTYQWTCTWCVDSYNEIPQELASSMRWARQCVNNALAELDQSEAVETTGPLKGLLE